MNIPYRVPTSICCGSRRDCIPPYIQDRCAVLVGVTLVINQDLGCIHVEKTGGMVGKTGIPLTQGSQVKAGTLTQHVLGANCGEPLLGC
jgi:hypothetical protein